MKAMDVKGIQYVVGANGEKTAVMLDLKKHRRLWEDVFDRLLAEQRKNEPRETLKQVKARLQRRHKSNGNG